MLVALVLLALSGAILFGSLSLATETWERGEAKSHQTRQMRLVSQFLHTTFNTAHPVRLNGAGESAFPFSGSSDSVTFPALLPERIGGGLYYFRLALTPGAKHSRLTLARIIPKYDSTDPPDFSDAEVSVLADDMRTFRVRYYGSNYVRGPDPAEPTWRDQWDDALQWPHLIRLEIVPADGPDWPPITIELELASQTVCEEIRRAHNQCDQN